jgi:hypothetical protein
VAFGIEPTPMYWVTTTDYITQQNKRLLATMAEIEDILDNERLHVEISNA